MVPFAGLSSWLFSRSVTSLRREGADAVRRGRPWSLRWRTGCCQRRPVNPAHHEVTMSEAP